jgi:hypothetical protein
MVVDGCGDGCGGVAYEHHVGAPQQRDTPMESTPPSGWQRHVYIATSFGANVVQHGKQDTTGAHAGALPHSSSHHTCCACAHDAANTPATTRAMDLRAISCISVVHSTQLQ